MLARLVIGFKLLLLPLRLFTQSLLISKDAGALLVNQFKELSNVIFKTKFEIPKDAVSFDNIKKRLDDVKGVVIDTFTIDKLEKPDIPENDKKKYEEAGKELGKNLSNGISKGVSSGESERELTGALEKQRKVVSDLSAERDRADESQLANITERLRLAELELKRLEDIGIIQAETVL